MRRDNIGNWAPGLALRGPTGSLNRALEAVLAERGLAESVWAGADESEADLTMFSIEVSLTAKP